MRNAVSIVCLWTATLMMMLSTIVVHHHHYERVCIVMEHCADDGHASPHGDTPEAEEGHSHGEADKGSCRIHQLHKFIINKSTVKNIRHHILGGITALAPTLACSAPQPTRGGMVSTMWQHIAASPCDAALRPISRRGPPQNILFS